MLARAMPLTLLGALVACDAQPAITSPVACQQRILAVKQSTVIDLAHQARTLSNAFRELSEGYAKLDVSDCNETQRSWIDRLRKATSDISKRAAEIDSAKQSKAASDSRIPDPAVMELSADISGYQNRLEIIKRELKAMQAGS